MFDLIIDNMCYKYSIIDNEFICTMEYIDNISMVYKSQ